MIPSDIVRFAFLIQNPALRKSEKLRPSFILEVQTLNGRNCAWLGYGASAMPTSNQGYELNVKRPPDMQKFGQEKPIRFFLGVR